MSLTQLGGMSGVGILHWVLWFIGSTKTLGLVLVLLIGSLGKGIRSSLMLPRPGIILLEASLGALAGWAQLGFLSLLVCKLCETFESCNCYLLLLLCGREKQIKLAQMFRRKQKKERGREREIIAGEVGGGF